MPTTGVKTSPDVWSELAPPAATQFTAQLINRGGTVWVRFEESLPGPQVKGGLEIDPGEAVERRHGSGGCYARGRGEFCVCT